MLPPKLGIIAGGGVLPFQLLESVKQDGRPYFVLAIRDHADPALEADARIRLGALGEAIRVLRQAGCTDLVMGRHVRRPSLSELRPDWQGLSFLARTGAALLGDDGLLRALRREFEAQGFRLIGPQDVLSSLLCPAGPLTVLTPDETALQDIRRGQAVLQALSAQDVGQAVIVQQGLILGLEAVEGTGELIRRCKAYVRAGAAPVLVKLSKRGQDTQLDTPAIGPKTIAQAQAAGLRGIALQAGGSLILQRAETLAAAKQANMFIVGLEMQEE